MSTLQRMVVEYLAVRRSLGFNLKQDEWLLRQFVGYMEDVHAETITVEHAVAWATSPVAADRMWWGRRMVTVRMFAQHVRNFVPETEVPPADVLPFRTRRRTPFLYSDDDIRALIAAVPLITSMPFRVATYQTLIGLLWVTGMRPGEVIALDRSDFDATHGALTVRRGKLGKSREVPVHSTCVDALSGYLGRADRPSSATPSLFVSLVGKRLRETAKSVMRSGAASASAAGRGRGGGWRRRCWRGYPGAAG